MTNEELLKALHSAVAEFHDDLGVILGFLEAAEKKTQPAPVVEPTAIDKFIEPTTASLEDVRHALTTLAGVHGAAAPKNLLAAYNVKKLSELNPIHFTAVFHAANAEAKAND